MLNLELVMKLKQPKWPLLPFEHNPPSIDSYKINKSDFPDVLQQGIYKIEVSETAMRYYSEDLYLVNLPDYWNWKSNDGHWRNMPNIRNKEMKIKIDNRVWIKGLTKRTIQYQNGVFTIYGVFTKQGSTISFDPLAEEAIAWVV